MSQRQDQKPVTCEEFRERVAQAIFGRSRKGCGVCGAEHCVACGSYGVQPRDFRDDVSRREWDISRMCQACQDLTFKDCPDCGADCDCGCDEIEPMERAS